MGRKKLSEDRLRKKIKTTVNNDLITLYEEFLEENNIVHKSRLIEKELIDIINNPSKINELLNNGILPKNNKLL